jgi:hypothetical protein
MASTVASSFDAARAGAAAPKTLRLTSQATYKRTMRDEPPPGAAPASTYAATIGSIKPDVAAERCVAARLAVRLNDMVHDATQKIPATTYDRIVAEVEADLAAERAAAPALGLGLSSSARSATGSDGVASPGGPAAGTAVAGAGDGSAAVAGGAGASGRLSASGSLRTTSPARAPSPSRSTLSLTAPAPDGPAAAAAQMPSFAHLTAVLEGPRHGIRGAMVRDFFAATHSADGPFEGSRSAQVRG